MKRVSDKAFEGSEAATLSKTKVTFAEVDSVHTPLAIVRDSSDFNILVYCEAVRYHIAYNIVISRCQECVGRQSRLISRAFLIRLP